MRDEYMTEKTPPLPHVEPCVLCQQIAVEDPECLNYWHPKNDCPIARLGMWTLHEWNKFQRRILAELRKSFEAGFCQVLKLGTARPEDAEYYWRDYLAERKA